MKNLSIYLENIGNGAILTNSYCIKLFAVCQKKKKPF